MTVDELPRPVDEYGVPRVPGTLAVESHSRSVLGALGVAAQRVAAQTGVAASSSSISSSDVM